MSCGSVPGQQNCQALPVHAAEEGAEVGAEDRGQHVVAPVRQVIRGGPGTKHTHCSSHQEPWGVRLLHSLISKGYSHRTLTGATPKSNYLIRYLCGTTLILPSLVFQLPSRAEPGLDKICSLKKRWFNGYIKHLCCLHFILLWIYKEYSSLSDSAVQVQNSGNKRKKENEIFAH